MGSCKVVCKGGKTKQSFKGECDINKLMARYAKAGVMPTGNAGVFADVSDVPDYQRSLELVDSAQRSFNALSLQVRRRFDYNPLNLMKFLADKANDKEAIELGLVVKPAEPVQPANPAV